MQCWNWQPFEVHLAISFKKIQFTIKFPSKPDRNLTKYATYRKEILFHSSMVNVWKEAQPFSPVQNTLVTNMECSIRLMGQHRKQDSESNCFFYFLSEKCFSKSSVLCSILFNFLISLSIINPLGKHCWDKVLIVPLANPLWLMAASLFLSFKKWQYVYS